MFVFSELRGCYFHAKPGNEEWLSTPFADELAEFPEASDQELHHLLTVSLLFPPAEGWGVHSEFSEDARCRVELISCAMCRTAGTNTQPPAVPRGHPARRGAAGERERRGRVVDARGALPGPAQAGVRGARGEALRVGF